MSNLTDFFGKSATRVAGTSPHNQPAFAILGGANTHHKIAVYSHDLSLMAHSHMYNNTANQMESLANVGLWNHQNSVSSNNNQNNGHGINNNGYLGNASLMASSPDFFLDSSANRALMGMHRHDRRGASIAMVGTNPGIKQNYALATSHDAASSDTWIRVCGRSNSAVTRTESNRGGWLSEERAICRPQDAGWLTSGYRLASGGISYNQNTGNAVIIERNNSSAQNPWRPVLLKNCPNPAKYLSDQAAWEAAITAAVAVSGNRIVGPDQTASTTKSAAGYTAVKAVLCDDNSVVIMYGVNNGVEIIRWVWDNSANTWAAQTTSDRKNRGWTTLFHQLEGVYPNFTMSLDGKTIVLTSQAYYYAAGYYLTMIDVATGHTKSYYKEESAKSYSIIPLGASKFLFSSSRNTDGNDRLYANVVSWDDLHTNPATDYWASGFVNAIPGATPQLGFLDTPDQTTNYPAVIPIPNIDNEAIVLAEKGEI
jgi:hypothetical protein